MTEIVITEYNQVYDKIYCESGVAMELSEEFMFYANNYKHHPKYKFGSWDGRIRLYNTKTKELYAGLRPHVENFAKERNYSVKYVGRVGQDEVSLLELEDFIKKKMKLPEKLVPYDYQKEAVLFSLRNKRSLMISPTSSGKSLIAYIIARWYAMPTLIVVPTIALVTQMKKDFESYGFDVEQYVQTISEGEDKKVRKPIVISTWQSIFKMPKKWFDTFKVFIGDEAHTFKATSLIAIMTKLTDCEYRFGMTGTLDGSEVNKLVLEGLFGRMKVVTTTKNLQETDRASKLKIKGILLNYSDEIKKAHKKDTYVEEMTYIVTNEKRNKFIRNLALSLENNTLLLFQYVEKQGKVLYDMLKEKMPDREICFVSGEVKGPERERIRNLAEQRNDVIIVASYGTFSTGINIKNLHNIVFCSPSKSRIRILQSIGRVLRLHDDKEFATLIDIADDLTWKSHTNHTYTHFQERLIIYNNEDFNYKLYRVDL